MIDYEGMESLSGLSQLRHLDAKNDSNTPPDLHLLNSLVNLRSCEIILTDPRATDLHSYGVCLTDIAGLLLATGLTSF